MAKLTSYLLIVFLMVGLILSPAAIFAQTKPAAAPATPDQKPKTEAPPAPAPLKDLQFPKFVERTLSNGIQVVVIEHSEMPVVSMRAAIRAGAVHDPKGKAGLAELTASLLDQGTAKRSAQQIQSEIDFVGGSIGASADWDAIYTNAFVLRDSLDLGLDLLSDIMLNPAFPPEEIERKRKQTLDGLVAAEQQPDYVASAVMDAVLFRGSPYAAPLSGTSQSVAALTREDVVNYHRDYFKPNNTIIAVAGDVKAEEIFAKLEKAFSGWAKGPAPALPKVNLTQSAGNRIVVIDRPESAQTEIRVGQLGIARSDPAYLTAVLTNYILGGGGFGSRLIEEIRVKRGLTYGVGSVFNTRLLQGKFQVATSTKNDSTIEVVKLILHELNRLQSEPVPATELEPNKSALIGRFPLTIEAPDDIASQVLNVKLYNLGEDYLKTYRQRLAAVSAGDIQQFVKRALGPNQNVIVLVGKAADFEGQLAELGKVEKIAYRDLDLASESLKREAAAVSGAERESALATLRAGIAALGGEAFLNQKSLKLVGSGALSPPGLGQSLPAESITFYALAPYKNRVEMNFPGFGTVVQASNGQAAYLSQMGQVQEMPAQKPALDLLREYDQPGVIVRPLPETKVADKPVKVVEITDSKGEKVVYHFDAQTNLLVKYQTGVGTPDAVDILVSDYRPINGVQVPFKQTIMMNGQPFLELNVKEATINVELDPKLFEKP